MMKKIKWENDEVMEVLSNVCYMSLVLPKKI